MTDRYQLLSQRLNDLLEQAARVTQGVVGRAKIMRNGVDRTYLIEKRKRKFLQKAKISEKHFEKMSEKLVQLSNSKALTKRHVKDKETETARQIRDKAGELKREVDQLRKDYEQLWNIQKRGQRTVHADHDRIHKEEKLLQELDKELGKLVSQVHKGRSLKKFSGIPHGFPEKVDHIIALIDKILTGVHQEVNIERKEFKLDMEEEQIMRRIEALNARLKKELEDMKKELKNEHKHLAEHEME